MKFSEQIKELRNREKLTQEQFADKLNITRQAVSNWENDRNLPDIEMLILIAQNFHISLDELILGGNDMLKENIMNHTDEMHASPKHGEMVEKLVKDGSENRRVKMNLISAIIGGVLMFMGLMCLVIKGLSVEYIDASGILHENFFLLPVGFLFIFCGVLIILVSCIRTIIKKIQLARKPSIR